jgi:DisA bacterial checkpoint controller nucleotide-binding
VISWDRFSDNFVRSLPGASENDARTAWGIMKAMMNETHGSMVVFAPDAAEEAVRLSRQGMVVSPTTLNDELLSSAVKIDGSILADHCGRCHAVGVILDGAVNDACTPARGSRYNSTVRYVAESKSHRLAIVKSEDGSIDVLPLLLPRVDHKLISDAIRALEAADLDNYHKPRLFLDEHRFYITEEECNRINHALDRLDALPREPYVIRLGTDRFRPDPEMNATYYL